MAKQPESLSMTFLRLWLWVVPIGMLVAAGVFGTIAALDESWALLVVMVLMAFFAIGLLMLHWWAMYRFGSGQDSGPSSKEPVASSKRGSE